MPLLGTRGAASARGFGFGGGAKPVPIIGSALGGGYFAGQISMTGNGVATHNLIISDKSVGYTTGLAYDTDGTVDRTNSFYDGAANTATLSAAGANYEAARWCDNLNIGGYTDWYLPASWELEILYYNLKPTTQNNQTYGSNPYSVNPPPNTAYTTTDPAQTVATEFQSPSGTQFLNTGIDFRSSTQRDSNPEFAWVMYMNYGARYYTGSGSTAKAVRAIRKIPV